MRNQHQNDIWKNSLEGFNRRLGRAEERISKLKAKSLEIIQSEEQKRKKNEKEGGKPKEYIEHNQTDQYMN